MEKDRKRNHPKGCGISLIEMIQMILIDSEVMTVMVFIQIQTIPLELRTVSERVCKINNIVDDSQAVQEDFF